MAILAWGIAVASVVTAVALAAKPRYVDPASVAISTVATGFGGLPLAYLAAKHPVLDNLGFGAFIIGAAVGPAVWMVLSRQTASVRSAVARQREQEKRLVAAHENAAREKERERRGRRDEDERSFFAQPGWPHQCQCESDGQTARLLIKEDQTAIRIVDYTSDLDFRVIEDFELLGGEIVAAEITTASEQMAIYRTETVPVITTNKKSPVGRAVAGAIVAGPVGAVVGAVSGASGRVEAGSETRKVFSHYRNVEGVPILALTTTSASRPLIKLTFDKVESAEVWRARIRAVSAIAGR